VTSALNIAQSQATLCPLIVKTSLLSPLVGLATATLTLFACATGTDNQNIGSPSTGGSAGSAGANGEMGTAGSATTNGSAGTSSAGMGGTTAGTNGSSGNAGEGGASGASTAGGSGSAGESGTAGMAGTSGMNGMSGSAGASGSSGTGGTSGAGGTSGTGGTAGTGGTGGMGGSGGVSGSSGSGGFQTCATGSSLATPIILPVDIIWMVDNSSSMQPAITEITNGLNNFANLIGNSSLDYKVIMLSLRGKTPQMIGGSNRYPVCIPSPLAGDNNCGNGTHFFQSSIDVRSTQPYEQFLGTLGQTAGYMVGETKGGDPWKDQLRANSVKSMVFVTDDDSRLGADYFLNFPGGKNPFNSLTLPPGILKPTWNNLFANWIAHGIYGWGSLSDPSVKCEYPDTTKPPSAGQAYTDLILASGGSRAQICADAQNWTTFFNNVAKSVIDTSKIACEIPLPPPPNGEVLNPAKINVTLKTPSTEQLIYQVDGPAGPTPCNGTAGGWYYDNATNPTQVILCPASCTQANQIVGIDKEGGVEVTFGCSTIKP
jgi:hypothetical protein